MRIGWLVAAAAVAFLITSARRSELTGGADPSINPYAPLITSGIPRLGYPGPSTEDAPQLLAPAPSSYVSDPYTGQPVTSYLGGGSRGALPV